MTRTFGAESLDDTVVTYAWSDAEIAKVEAYVNRLPDWVPPAPAATKLNGSAAPIGHNSFGAGISHITGSASTTAIEAVLNADKAVVPALTIVSLDRLRQAIRDDRLDRSHLKVLANLSERFNAETYTGWPSRELIAEEEGLDPKSVNNNFYDLRRLEYIDWERRPDPKKPRRTLQHYWWLQDEITAVVIAMREKAAAESAPHRGQKTTTQKLPPIEGKKSALQEGQKQKLPSPGGTKTAPYRGNKELLKEKEKREGANAPTLPLDVDATDRQHRQPIKPATKDAEVDAKGRDRGSRLPDNWALPDEWRADARGLGLSDTQIETQARKFAGHWTTAAPRNAVKRNWRRVWINWIQNEIDRYGLKPAAKSGTAGASPLDPSTIPPAAWRQFVRAFHDGGTWPPGIGPPPDRPGCLAPPEILREFDYPTTGASK